MIRCDEGPYLIEAMTYRWLEHCGPNFDNHLGYRTEKEFLEWKKKDPVSNLENKLLQESIISSKFIETLRQGIIKEVKESIDYAKSSPFPDIGQLTRDVYADQ